jgi:hypothetical protein
MPFHRIAFLVSSACAAASAAAQTVPVPPVGGCGQSQMLYFDDGVYEVGWRITFQTAVGDAFAVDFDDLCGNMTITGVAIATMATGMAPPGPMGLRYIALCPDNLAVSSLGRTPDLGAPLSIRNSSSGAISGSPGPTFGFCPGLVGYDVPDAIVPTSGGLHAVTTFVTGDSSSFICADTTQPSAGHSTFTSTGYSVPAVIDGWDSAIRVIGHVNPTPGSAYVTVNNATNDVTIGQTQQIAVTLWSTCATQPTAYLQGAFLPTFIPVPSTVLFTGFENGASISDQFQGTICAPLSDPSAGPCVPAGATFDVGAFYLDNCTLKKNGKPKLRLTNLVGVVVTADLKQCNPCVCFGQQDDGQVDFTVWKIQQPAGSRDYFSVRQGSFIDPNSGSPCGTTVTDLRMSSWDFCGTTNSWASAGLYQADTVLDPTGNTPALLSPVALCTTLSIPMGSSTAAIFDFPDVSTSTSTSLVSTGPLHTVAQWMSGDTCVWVNSDTDGTDDDSTSTGACSSIPSTTSYFTIDGFTTAAASLPSANWIQRVDWF